MESTEAPHGPKAQDPGDSWGRQTNLDKLVSLIQREPEARMDFECNEFIQFLKKYIEWFSGIKNELIKEIIKNCRYLKCPPETVIIKQGDLGDSMYAILRGSLAVHVIFETENEKECYGKVEAAMTKKKFNRNDLGNEVAQKGSGACIGEVALIQENCMRTASCITATDCEFIVIDRALYNVSVKDFIEREFQDKTQFVERNPLFSSWTPRQRNQLVISLKKQKVGFGDRLVRQGQELDGVYFIFKGDLEIHIDSRMYKRQYPMFYAELQNLLPEMVGKNKRAFQAPHVLRKERMAGHRPQQLCILGANESVGSLEMTLGLDTYIETAVSPGECELVMLKRTQFERMFKRKYAATTLEKLREALAQKLCLYIYQSEPQNTAFLKFLNMKLMDATVLQEVKKSKHARARQEANIGQISETRTVEEKDIANVLKRLHMSSESAAQLPPEDMSELALAKMDRRLKLWSEKTNMNGSKLAELQSSTLHLNLGDNAG
ncbi:uncharacterized protein LOC101859221 [Aplysia californica]|uniref:Uncharacterized protein LOC101859221 n=1 Tax=Aplysia californica TaxID=6500 RepID=A0ABM0KAL4_APLCA|nr:uncharacterized protein LOC101859221 [Aplysia californica]